MWLGVSVYVLKLPPHTTAGTGWSYSMLWWWTAFWREVGVTSYPGFPRLRGFLGGGTLGPKTTEVQGKQGRVDHPTEIATKTHTEKHQFMPSSQFYYQTETFNWRKIHRLLEFGVILGISLRGLEGWNACLWPHPTYTEHCPGLTFSSFLRKPVDGNILYREVEERVTNSFFQTQDS